MDVERIRYDSLLKKVLGPNEELEADENLKMVNKRVDKTWAAQRQRLQDKARREFEEFRKERDAIKER